MSDPEQEAISRAYEQGKLLDKQFQAEHKRGLHEVRVGGCTLCFYTRDK